MLWVSLPSWRYYSNIQYFDCRNYVYMNINLNKNSTVEYLSNICQMRTIRLSNLYQYHNYSTVEYRTIRLSNLYEYHNYSTVEYHKILNVQYQNNLTFNYHNNSTVEYHTNLTVKYENNSTVVFITMLKLLNAITLMQVVVLWFLCCFNAAADWKES